ncbi:hypothetical protein P5V15_001909 [Pogonomyrmex californicus]
MHLDIEHYTSRFIFFFFSQTRIAFYNDHRLTNVKAKVELSAGILGRERRISSVGIVGFPIKSKRRERCQRHSDDNAIATISAEAEQPGKIVTAGENPRESGFPRGKRTCEAYGKPATRSAVEPPRKSIRACPFEHCAPLRVAAIKAAVALAYDPNTRGRVSARPPRDADFPKF